MFLMGVAGVGARQSGGAHVLVSTDAKVVLFSLMTQKPGPTGELGDGMKFGRLLAFQLIGEKK